MDYVELRAYRSELIGFIHPSPPCSFHLLPTDPRVADWMWMQSPLPTILILILYWSFVYFGPRYMEKRPAFTLKPVLFVFNSFIVALTVWMTWEVRLFSLFFPFFRAVMYIALPFLYTSFFIFHSAVAIFFLFLVWIYNVVFLL